MPESPIWLLSKYRPNEAKKSLQWLRGWVSPQAIHAEYSELEKYSERSNACTTCARQSIRCNHPRPKLYENRGEFKRKRSLKPFILIVSMQFFVEFSGISVWTPYIIQVLKAQGIPLDAHFATVIMSGIGFAAHVCLLLSVHTFGKRKICLFSTLIVGLSSFALGPFKTCILKLSTPCIHGIFFQFIN